MNRWPDFLIVGAGRAGTTSLFEYLRSHPDIFMPTVKEPHFFSQTNSGEAGVLRRSRYQPVTTIRDEGDYLNLFKKARPDQLIGEASVFYLPDEATPQRIKETIPEAKIIAILREPADRAHSSYLLAIRERLEHKTSFYDALLEDYDYLQAPSGVGSVYIGPGLYYRQVKRYLDMFGSDRVRIYLYEDLVADTFGLVRDVCTFLGVPFYDGSFFDASRTYNSYVISRNALSARIWGSRTARSLASVLVPRDLLMSVGNQLVRQKQPKPPLDPKAREFQRSIYHDDILKLEGLIGKDLGSWLTY